MTALRGQSLPLGFTAWDTALNAGKTGDSANFTMRWVKDGTIAAMTGSPSVSEPDSTNAPGLYAVTVAAADAACVIGALCGKSSTASVSLMPVIVVFQPFQGLALTVPFVVWDTSANAGKTGDSANITLKWAKDGITQDLTGAPAISELDATNAPGLYKVTVPASDTWCKVGVLCGKSSTASVSVVPVLITFAPHCYNCAKKAMIDGTLHLDGTDDIRIALVMSNTTADTENDTISVMTDFTTLDRCDSAGYADKALTESTSRDDTNDRAEADAVDDEWSNLPASTRQVVGMVFYKFVTGDADSIPIRYEPFATPITLNGDGDVVVTFDAEGWLWVE